MTTEVGEEWECPKPGCELDADGHSLELALEHCMEIDEQDAREVADRTLAKVAGLLGVYSSVSVSSKEPPNQGAEQ